MKLIGSGPSPYVRRLRLWLEGDTYEFVNLDIYSPKGRAELKRYTPAMKIPVLVDGDQTIYDSRVIHRYLNEKLQRETLSWEQQNALTLIDAANDSFVTTLLLKRSGIDPSQNMLIMNLQRERLVETMALLEQKVAEGEFADWQYPAICLYCLLDWIDFRELYTLTDMPNLAAFHQRAAEREIVQQTDPRRI